ncbi:MAG: hypothetical protein ABIQ64_02205 [Candidatus Saccharimonadales bacterium]
MKRTEDNTLQKILRVAWLLTTAAQTIWMLILYSGWVINAGILTRYLDFIGTSQEVSRTTYEIPSILSRPLEVVVVFVIVAMTLYILVRAPKNAAQITVRTAEQATKVVEPIVRRTVSKKAHPTKPWFSNLLARTLISVLLFVATIPAHYIVVGISLQIAWTITASLGVFAFIVGMITFSQRRMSRSS